MGGPGCGDRIVGVGLSGAPAALPVGPVDLDDGHLVVQEVAGESRAVAAGAFDADQLDGPEALQPGQQFAIARGVAGKLSTPSWAPRSSRAAATCTSRWVSTPPVIAGR